MPIRNSWHLFTTHATHTKVESKPTLMRWYVCAFYAFCCVTCHIQLCVIFCVRCIKRKRRINAWCGPSALQWVRRWRMSNHLFILSQVFFNNIWLKYKFSMDFEDIVEIFLIIILLYKALACLDVIDRRRRFWVRLAACSCQTSKETFVQLLLICIPFSFIIAFFLFYFNFFHLE